MYYLDFNQTNEPIVFKMTQANGSPLTGATLTVQISKNGSAFSLVTGTVSEISNGFYKYQPVAADVSTPGDLKIRAVAGTGEVNDSIDVHVNQPKSDNWYGPSRMYDPVGTFGTPTDGGITHGAGK